MSWEHKAPDEMEQFFTLEGGLRGRRRALERFVEAVRAGDSVPDHLMEFVALGVRHYLDVGEADWLKKAPHRPKRDADVKVKFFCWFAANHDPGFAHIPKSKGGRYAAVGAAFGCDESTARRHAREFNAVADSATAALLLPAKYGAAYAAARQIPWSDAMRRLMAESIKTAKR
jgi:hypothetical protein